MTQMQPPGPAYQPPAAAAKGRGLAIASLVLGICGFLPVFGVPCGLLGVIFGTMTLARRARGKGMAVAGIVLALVGMVLVQTWTVIGLRQLFERPRQMARQSVCAANLSVIGKVVHIYDSEYRLPPADLALAIKEYGSPEVCKCPSASPGRAEDYFYKSPGAIEDVAEPALAIMACDFKGNHRDGRNVLYVDGHVVWVTEAQFQAQLAKPENAAFAAALREAEGP